LVEFLLEFGRAAQLQQHVFEREVVRDPAAIVFPAGVRVGVAAQDDAAVFVNLCGNQVALRRAPGSGSGGGTEADEGDERQNHGRMADFPDHVVLRSKKRALRDRDMGVPSSLDATWGREAGEYDAPGSGERQGELWHGGVAIITCSIIGHRQA
jgi:hypothetical protein